MKTQIIKSPLHSDRMKCSGFTLIEVLAVVAILVILIVMLFPLVGKARLSAASATCVSNLRTLGMAHAGYRAENNGCSPPQNVLYEGHKTTSGIGFLRAYYVDGAGPYAWNGGTMLPTPNTEICPVVRLRPDLDGNGIIFGDYCMMPNDKNTNLSALPNQSKIPVLFDGWNSAWKNSDGAPLRHYNFNGINAVFLDGHVETIPQDINDGRLYFDWWYGAIRGKKPDNAKLGQGFPIGSLERP